MEELRMYIEVNSFGYICTSGTHFTLCLASVIVEAWKTCVKQCKLQYTMVM